MGLLFPGRSLFPNVLIIMGPTAIGMVIIDKLLIHELETVYKPFLIMGAIFTIGGLIIWGLLEK